MSWLQELLRQHDELEPPTNFWLWAGLATISAVVKDSVYIDRGGGYYNLYPNIYVMFHADSGLKKGPPIALAKDLVKRVNNTRIISGRSSIQGILKELGTAYTMPGGKVVNKSVAFICSSELTSSLVEDKAAATILTDLYDRHYNEGEWRSLLKMETFQLKDPTITMLTATNEAHSEDFFARRDIQGGYFARTFIIYETEEHTVNSLIMPLKNAPNRAQLSEYLKELGKLQGPFAALGSREETEVCNIKNGEGYWSPAGKLYDDWYKQFKADAKIQQVKDDTGTINRFGDSVLKVAMCLSLSKKLELSIDEFTMQESITMCEKLIGNVRRTTLGKKGKSTYAFQQTLLIEQLLKRQNHMISRLQVNKQFWMHASSDEWDNIAKSMETAGTIVIETVGNQIIYRMPEAEVEKWVNHLRGKNK